MSHLDEFNSIELGNRYCDTDGFCKQSKNSEWQYRSLHDKIHQYQTHLTIFWKNQNTLWISLSQKIIVPYYFLDNCIAYFFTDNHCKCKIYFLTASDLHEFSKVHVGGDGGHIVLDSKILHCNTWHICSPNVSGLVWMGCFGISYCFLEH